MRAAVLGGTFNPVHIGHLYLADEVRLKYDYDRVLFVPDNIPAHKEPAEETTSAERLDMLDLALSTYNYFSVDACEIDRGGVSYSIETVRYIMSNYQITGKLGFVIGDDLIEGFDSWKEAKRLSEEVDLIVAHRSIDAQKRFDYPHRYLDNMILPISSSDIRKRIGAGWAVQFLVPHIVWRYIEKKKLYRSQGENPGVSTDR
jgi:nicotinate-nucleotide adenylyltransferase